MSSGWLSRNFRGGASSLVKQAMTGTAEGGQVFRYISASLFSRNDVMDLQEAGSAAARGLATVLVAGQDLASCLRGYRRLVTASILANCGITTHSVSFWAAEFTFPGFGLNGHPARVFMNMDLHGRPTGEGPPGALFPGFHGLDQSGQGLQHQLGLVVGYATQLVKVFNQSGPPRFLLRGQVHLETNGKFLRGHNRGCLG
jgi:hypothetical protein